MGVTCNRRERDGPKQPYRATWSITPKVYPSHSRRALALMVLDSAVKLQISEKNTVACKAKKSQPKAKARIQAKAQERI